MQSWTSDPPLELPIDFGAVARLDLDFEGVRRDAGTFTAFVFVNDDGDVPADAGRDRASFVGSFTIFGPARCWGADDHCDWEQEPVSPFDRRPPHHLTPINVTMNMTDALKRLGNPDALTVTVHAARLDEPELDEGVLRFDQLTAHAYQ